MNSIIVLTPTGGMYDEMAELCTESLRGTGCYTGRIVWLEGREDFDAADRMAMRMGIPDAVDLTPYDRLWYLDCDILVTEPWEIVETHLDNMHVAAISEAATTKVADPFTRACLTGDELCKYGARLAVNSGVVGVNMLTDWLPMWGDWQSLTRERLEATGGLLDESAPNAVALRHDFARLRGLVYYPANPASRREGTALTHFAGMGADEKLLRMRQASA